MRTSALSLFRVAIPDPSFSPLSLLSYAEITHILASSTLAPLPSVPQQELNAPPRRGGGRGKGGSKAGVLRKTVGLIRWLSEGNQWMEEEVGRLEREAGGG